MKNHISRRHFLKYVLSNAALFTAGNVVLWEPSKEAHSKIICPQCQFTCEDFQKNALFTFHQSVRSYCPNCGINFHTLKHDVRCSYYPYCLKNEFLRQKKQWRTQSVSSACFHVPFQASGTCQYSEKPRLNLDEINF